MYANAPATIMSRTQITSATTRPVLDSPAGGGGCLLGGMRDSSKRPTLQGAVNGTRDGERPGSTVRIARHRCPRKYTVQFNWWARRVNEFALTESLCGVVKRPVPTRAAHADCAGEA